MSDTQHCLHWDGNGLLCCFCGTAFAVAVENRIPDNPNHGIHWIYMPNSNKECWVRTETPFPSGDPDYARLGG